MPDTQEPHNANDEQRSQVAVGPKYKKLPIKIRHVGPSNGGSNYYIYHFVDSDGYVLYVGRSSRRHVEQRINSHRNKKWWASKAVRIYIEIYPKYVDAVYTEGRKIRSLRPPGNQMNNPDWAVNGRLPKNSPLKSRKPKYYVRNKAPATDSPDQLDCSSTSCPFKSICIDPRDCHKSIEGTVANELYEKAHSRYKVTEYVDDSICVPRDTKRAACRLRSEFNDEQWAEFVIHVEANS